MNIQTSQNQASFGNASRIYPRQLKNLQAHLAAEHPGIKVITQELKGGKIAASLVTGRNEFVVAQDGHYLCDSVKIAKNTEHPVGKALNKLMHIIKPNKPLTSGAEPAWSNNPKVILTAEELKKMLSTKNV